jgi:integrase
MKTPHGGALTSEVLSMVPAEAAEVRRLHDHARAEATKRAYAADWKHFESWCEARGYTSLPATPDALALYLGALAGRFKMSTIERRLATIRVAHATAGFDAPTRHPAVREARAGARRLYGVATAGKAPALADDIRAMVGCLPDTLLGARDRALLLAGFAGGFRRSELVAIDVEHLQFDEAGVRIAIPRSKTDQEGEGATIGIHATGRSTCPVAALRAWLERAAIVDGPVFRPVDRHGNVRSSRLRPAAVADVVKRAAIAAGLENPERYSGHSLRAGLVTEAFARGAAEHDIMRQTRHKDSRTLRRYRREGRLWINNVTENIGL